MQIEKGNITSEHCRCQNVCTVHSENIKCKDDGSNWNMWNILIGNELYKCMDPEKRLLKQNVYYIQIDSNTYK